MKNNTSDIIHNTSRQPKLSVIIPLYNKAPYIKKALESVFAQTFKDWELIVVDDGSSDDSATICEKFIKEASQTIHNTLYIIHQTNSGVSAARNNGVAQASGEYIAFLDADDWWEPTYLEKMAQLIEDYPEAGLYACNYVYYKPGKTRVAVSNIATGYFNYPKAYYEAGAMPVWTGATMMPRRVFDEMGGFPLGIKLGEDFLLWAKIAMQYKVAFLNEPLAWYNNDVPATLRATRNLHTPEHHMLFNLGVLGNEAIRQEKGEADITMPTRPIAQSPYRPSDDDWRRLIDKLRTSGLLDYWLDKRYHNLAAEELNKVDWNKQPTSVKNLYKIPICMLKTKRLLMRWGSVVKQVIIKVMR